MAGPKFHKYDRAGHEAAAIRLVDRVLRPSGYNTDCSPKGLRSLTTQAKSVAQARTHLVSIGTSSRTSKRLGAIWGRIGKAEKSLEHHMQQILRSCKVDGVSLAGHRSRRR
jgi:hypothetical protein